MKQLSLSLAIAVSIFSFFTANSQSAYDAGIVSIDSPQVFCPGVHNIVASLQNFGNNMLDSVIINWQINSATQTQINWTTQLDTAGGLGPNVTQVVLGSRNFVLGQADTIKAWTTLPNGVPDTSNANDSAVAIISAALSGTFTIGGTNPDFATFTDAVNEITIYGVCGPVVFNVRNGTYNEQISIPEITGSSGTNSITFQSELGDSSLVVLTYSANSTNNYTLRLVDADNFIFRQVTIEALNTSYGSAIVLLSGSNYNSFENNELRGVSTSTTGNATRRAVVYTSGLPNSHNIFTNNRIVNGTYGLYLRGSSSALTHGTTIEANRFENQYYMGIYLSYHNAPFVNENIIATNSAYTSFYGISMSSCDSSLQVSKNKITINNSGYGISLVYCDGTDSNRGLSANNFIHVGGTGTARGISCYGSVYQNFYYNNVNITSTHNFNGRCGLFTGGSQLNIVNT
ncbi:MAG TPA: hypothetical protein EYN38_09605, partial [Flavobacteriales bacterium]|nr:hypothetical protein [Flavobacteriales bacterium]